MRLLLLAALALAGCASAPPPQPPLARLPFSVGNGIGEQNGTYAALPGGETRGPSGEKCYIFAWDRPLSAEYAIRVTSSSCEVPGSPPGGPMIAREVSRTIIPLAQSNLLGEAMRSGQ